MDTTCILDFGNLGTSVANGSVLIWETERSSVFDSRGGSVFEEACVANTSAIPWVRAQPWARPKGCNMSQHELIGMGRLVFRLVG
jgi:hypothetical protein